VKTPIHLRLALGAAAIAVVACSSQPSSLAFNGLPSTTQAGNGLVFELTALASDGKTPVTGYTGTVFFVSDDAAGSIPGPYTYVAKDQGIHSFPLTFVTAGQHTLTAADSNVSSLHVSATISVTPTNPALISLVKGGGQIAAVGAKLPVNLEVNVVDSYGNASSGVTVAWGSPVKGATASPATSQTDLLGNASTAATLGNSPGTQAFTATVKGLVGSPITFSETAQGAPPANISIVSGNNQSFAVNAKLPAPLVVVVTDAFNNPSSQVTVNWTVASGGGSVLTATTTTGFDGTASTIAGLGPATGPNTFQASAVDPLTNKPVPGSPVTFTETGIPDTGYLTYTNPTATGKLQLVLNPATTQQVVVLDLVTTASLTGWAVGIDLPLDGTKVLSDPTTPIVPGTALSPGLPPIAASAALPLTGPFSNIFSSGLSQKASGAGAVPTDTTVPSGSLIYTVRLDRVPGAAPGVIFNGSSLPTTFRAGMLDKMGNEVAAPTDFAIGTLTAN
jgi:hypothetical protein